MKQIQELKEQEEQIFPQGTSPDKTGQPLNKTRLFSVTDPTNEGCPVMSEEKLSPNLGLAGGVRASVGSPSRV